MLRTSRQPQILLFLAVIFWLSACQVSSPTRPGATPSPQTTTQPPQHTPSPTARRTTAPDATAVPTPTRSVQVSTTALQGAQITFWHPFNGQNALVLAEMAAQFNQSNPWGISVQTTAHSGFGALDEAFRDTLRSETSPELVIGYHDQAIRWDNSGGSLVDIQTYLQDSEWGFPQSIQETYPAAIWAETLLPSGEGGRRLGLPWYRSGLFLAYNQTWAQSLGFEAQPETVRLLQTQACAAARALKSDAVVENDGRGGWLIPADPGVLVLWLYAFESKLISPEGNAYTLDNFQSREAVSTLSQGYNGHCFWIDETIAPSAAFANRQALMIVVSPPELAELKTQLSQAGFKDQWTIFPLPDLDGNPVVDLYGPAFVIPETTPERQLAAWAFVRWMSSSEGQAAWAQETGFLPASTAPLPALSTGATEQPEQWQAALEFVSMTRGEPVKASWGSVRWAMGEALVRLLSPELGAGELQAILAALQQLAEDIDHQYP